MKLNRIELAAIASIVHAANKAYCESLGDRSQVDWKDAPEWQRESAIKGVQFHSENRYSTPSDSHKSWMVVKEEEGWKYGPVKDMEKKEHPCFLPYEELPVEQQTKDFIFHGIVHAMVWESPMFPTRYGY